MAPDRLAEQMRTRPLAPDAVAVDLAAPAPAASETDRDAPALPGASLDARLHRAGATGGGRYELRGLEGVGATSRVYRVFDRNLAREVAVKVLMTGTDNAEDLASFVGEARITAELQHPNVLPVYELDAGGRDELYFSMKRIDGRALGGLLADAEDGKPDPRFTGGDAANALVNVFSDVCQALSYAHHRGIVHQDVKPDNIMLGDFGEVLLIDWGSAARIDDPKPRLYGTPLYMSPEQARLERATPASDVFCVGASLFHALIGRPPTAADSLDDLMRRRGAGEIDAPTADERAIAPPALLHIALKAMAVAPAQRYVSIDALLGDLRAYQAGLAVAAYAEPPWRRLWRWYRKHRRACWAGAASLVAVSCLALMLAVEQAKQRVSWALVHEEDFAHATPESVAQHWVGRVKTADSAGEFREEPLTEREHWRFADGKLVLASQTDYVDLAWRGGLGGDFRVEWDYTPERTNLSLDCFVGADREAGYTFHIGSLDPRVAELTRGRDMCDTRLLDAPLRVGRTYAFALERQGSRLRLDIDGARVFDFLDVDPLAATHGDAFGFDCYAERRQSIRRVRVYDRPFAELVSPLDAAAAVYQAGNAVVAARLYAEIARVHTSSGIAVSAQCLRGLCLLRGPDHRLGADLLRSFVKDHADHELAPVALVELEWFARQELHDYAETARLREQLKRWRGDPVLHRVLRVIAGELQQPMLPQPLVQVGDLPFTAEAPARILAAVAEFKRWADAYGMPSAGFNIVERAAETLGKVGRFDDALAVCPPDSGMQGKLLLSIGDYQGTLDRLGYHPRIRAQALFALERYAEMVEDTALEDNDRAQALVALGRADEALKRFPKSDAVGEQLLHERRLDEFSAIYAGHERDRESFLPFLTPRFRLMHARGEWQTILDDYSESICRIDALIALERYDEVLPLVREQAWAQYTIAVGLLERGERERALDIFHRLAARRLYDDGDHTIAYWLLAPLTPCLIEGAAPDLPRALEQFLAADHRWFGQRLWHLAALIAGREDEAAFRAQPRQQGIEGDLLFGLGLRADCLGQREAALAWYRASLDKPRTCGADNFIGWRIRTLGSP